MILGRRSKDPEQDMLLFALGELRGPAAWVHMIRAAVDRRYEARLRELARFSSVVGASLRGEALAIPGPTWILPIRRLRTLALVSVVLLAGGLFGSILVTHEERRNEGAYANEGAVCIPVPAPYESMEP